MLAKDDILGYVDVDFTKCITEAGTWAINNIYDLSGPPDVRGQQETLGNIYVQLKFLEEGMVDDMQTCSCIENLKTILSQKQGIFSGILKVFLVHAKNLIKDDEGKDSSSDPFVKFKVSGGK